MAKHKLISRRTFVAGTVGLIGGASLLHRTASAQTKSTQAEVEYQATPQGGDKCADCTFYEAGSNSCKVVDGTVAAEGWCNLYSKA